MQIFLTACISGVTIGSIYSLVGIGYTVVFNATGIFNLAQGSLVMVGVMSSYFGLVLLGLPQVVVAIGVPVFVCILALIEERAVVRRFLVGGASKLGWFIATLGVASIIEAAVVAMFGNHPVVAIPSPFPSRGLSIAGLTIDYRDIFSFGVLLVVMVSLDLFYQRTWLGRGMRATAQDRDAAALAGIKPETMSQLAFGMSGIVAGIAGFAIAPLVFSDPTIGLTFALKGFVALAIGGFGSVRGAVVGGLTLGVTEQLFDLYASSKYEVLSGLVLILIVLVVRPEGLFRSSVARTV